MIGLSGASLGVPCLISQLERARQFHYEPGKTGIPRQAQIIPATQSRTAAANTAMSLFMIDGDNPNQKRRIGYGCTVAISRPRGGQ